MGLCLAFLGICSGAMGSGVTCSAGFLSGYYENLLIWVELGLLIAFSWVWVPVGFILILSAVVSLGFALLASAEAARAKW